MVGWLVHGTAANKPAMFVGVQLVSWFNGKWFIYVHMVSRKSVGNQLTQRAVNFQAR